MLVTFFFFWHFYFVHSFEAYLLFFGLSALRKLFILFLCAYKNIDLVLTVCMQENILQDIEDYVTKVIGRPSDGVLIIYNLIESAIAPA